MAGREASRKFMSIASNLDDFSDKVSSDLHPSLSEPNYRKEHLIPDPSLVFRSSHVLLIFHSHHLLTSTCLYSLRFRNTFVCPDT